jgi:hypothetical protein
MWGSQAVIGLIDGGTVLKYDLTNDATVADGARQTLSGTSIRRSQDGSTVVMEFAKLLVEEGEVPIISSGDDGGGEGNSFLHARGSGDGLGYHDVRVSFVVDLAADDAPGAGEGDAGDGTSAVETEETVVSLLFIYFPAPPPPTVPSVVSFLTVPSPSRRFPIIRLVIFSLSLSLSLSLSTSSSFLRAQYDAVVIGAGWAGIRALETLNGGGATNVLVLEATGAVGGRCRSVNGDGSTNDPEAEDPPMEVHDLGAGWLYSGTAMSNVLEEGGYLDSGGVLDGPADTSVPMGLGSGRFYRQTYDNDDDDAATVTTSAMDLTASAEQMEEVWGGFHEFRTNRLSEMGGMSYEGEGGPSAFFSRLGDSYAAVRVPYPRASLTSPPPPLFAFSGILPVFAFAHRRRGDRLVHRTVGVHRRRGDRFPRFHGVVPRDRERRRELAPRH